MRRSGNTTRLVDRWVQEFFEKGITYIYEGRGEKNEREITGSAFLKFKNRMKHEHPIEEYNFEYGEFSGIKCFKVTKK